MWLLCNNGNDWWWDTAFPLFFFIDRKISDNMEMVNKIFIDIDFHVQKGALLGLNWHGASDMIVDLKVNNGF